ncbi:hypothetical protein IWW57_006561 [Coemansia sp. S610]|nr:hypothetical protein IWW57_006561 [Coemansia sp. S610]
MVLFRGNAATLEHLNLTLNCELATELLRENVFTPTSHPKLQSVILKPHPNMLLANSPAYSVFLQLVEEIAPDAVVREIDFRAYRLSTPPLLSLFGKFTNLQVLALPELRLSIWDAMALLKSLPLLSDFHAQSPVLDPLPDGVTKRGLVAYVRSNYSPMAPRFRCWHLGSSQDKYLKASAVLFLLLALACPNFDFVAAGASKREILTAALEKALGMATYKKYAPRLRRLLPRGLEL